MTQQDDDPWKDPWGERKSSSPKGGKPDKDEDEKKEEEEPEDIPPAYDDDPWREEPRAHPYDPRPGYDEWQRMSVEGLTGRYCSPTAPPEREPVTAWLRRNLENAGVRQDIASEMARSMVKQDPRWGRVWYAIAGGWQPTGPQGRAAVTAAVWTANEVFDGMDGWDMWDHQAPFEM